MGTPPKTVKLFPPQGARRMSEADGARSRGSRSAVIRSASLEASWRYSSPSWMTA